MDYKKFCKIFSVCAIIIIISILGLTVVVDPLGIIGSPIIKGFNHYKSKQDVYEYVWKPYLAADCKADVIFIGTSRVRGGWNVSLNEYCNEKVFNFGLANHPISIERKHLEMLYNIHIPKVVFIGVDFYQFNRHWSQKKIINYSEERLAIIGDNNRLITKLMALKDSFQLGVSASISTILQSMLNRNKDNRYERGYDRISYNKEFNKIAYESQIKEYNEKYGVFEYDELAIKEMKKMITDAKSKGIKVYVFINPTHKALLDLLQGYGHEQKWNEIKKEIINIAGKVYELKDAEKYISNNDFYYDCSHYNAKLGEILKAQILADN